jgi:arabinoxylan arabinofuranohydrolase
MMSKKIYVTIIFLVTLAMSYYAGAQNIVQQRPIIQTKYTADPAPLVYNDTVFLYVSHDEDDAESFKMLDWLLYTSTDMVNWTEHGAVASLKDFSWAPQDNGAWAIQCIERDGKFYMYCPMHGSGIGVLVADNPYGPFKDPLGKRLIDTDHIWNDIDPTPFIDDDGQAYLYWGNPDVYYVKLNEDMISTSGEVVKEPTKPDNYQEGPWVWKRDGYYYMAYASTCCPEGIGYAMSNSPTGPWEYKGMIVDASDLTRGNHPGIIEYKGRSFCFGHSYDLLKRSTSTFYERRSVDMDEIFYNEGGTIKNRHYWSVEGPVQIGTLNPFQRVEAETMAWSEGVKTTVFTEWERNIPWNKGKKVADHRILSSIHNGDFVKVQGVNFEQGASAFEARLAAYNGGKIEIHTGAIDGPIVATVEVPAKNDGGQWKTLSAPVENVKGTHDIYLVFKGERDLFELDWWRFLKN